MVFSFWEIIYSIVDAAVIVYFYNRFMTSKNISNHTLSIFTVVAGVLIQLMTPLSGVLLFVKMILTLMIFLLGFKVIYGEIVYVKTLMYIGWCIVVLLISEVIVGTLTYTITHISPQDLFFENKYRLFGAVLSKGVWFLILNFLFLRNNDKYLIKKNQIYFINLVIISNLMYLTFVIWLNTLIDIEAVLLKYITIAVTMSVLLMGVGIIGLFNRILKQNELELEWNLKESLYHQQYRYLQEISDVNRKLRSQRHDFLNHLNSLQGLVYLQKLNETRKYLEELTGDVYELNNEMLTSNPVINGLITIKQREAKERGIDFNVDIFYPENSHIRDNDIVTVLGNLIDNSFEAAEKSSEKRVDFKLKYKNGRSILSIINSKININITNNIGKVGYTTKDDKTKHGFGIYNVKKTVKMYEGMYDFQDKGEQFEVKVMF